MVDGFIPYWTDVMNKPDDPMYVFAKKMIEIPKVVFTKTLNKSKWVNTELAKGDLKDEVTKLKHQKRQGYSSLRWSLVRFFFD